MINQISYIPGRPHSIGTGFDFIVKCHLYIERPSRLLMYIMLIIALYTVYLYTIIICRDPQNNLGS